MPDIVMSAPGKVILHGEHSVVYGKVAVASSLNLRCFLRASFLNDDALVLDLPDVNIHQQWKLSSLQSELLPHLEQTDEVSESPSPPTEKSLQALRQFAGIQNESMETRELAIISFLFLYCSICSKQRELPRIQVRLVSQLPVGAGLGSSAAFSVCLAAILLQISGQLSLSVSDTMDQGDSHSSKKNACCWSEDDQLLINKWAFLGEKIIHGQPSGIDNSVSTLGGAICFQNKVIDPINKMPRLKILLVNTKVPRSTKMLVGSVRKRYDTFPEVMTPILEALDGVAKRSIKAYNTLYDQPNCSSIFTELEELIDMNQHLLNTLGVGHPSLDMAVQVTARHGLHTKLTGAGGGGCAYTLLTPETSAGHIQAAYSELQQCGFDCWETSVGATGVTLHHDPHHDDTVPKHLLQ